MFSNVRLSKLRIACSTGCHWHLHSHHKNVYATHKPAFSLFPHYPMLFQACLMSLKEICIAKLKLLSSHIVLKPSFSNVTNQQFMGTNIWRQQCPRWCVCEVISFMLSTPDNEISYMLLFILKCHISGTFWGYYALRNVTVFILLK
jgi:hypothetical protein